jgi:hypothetical protein
VQRNPLHQGSTTRNQRHRTLTAGKEIGATHVGVSSFPSPKRTLLLAVTWTWLAESSQELGIHTLRNLVLRFWLSWRADQDPCYRAANHYGFSIKRDWTYPYQWDLRSTSPALFPSAYSQSVQCDESRQQTGQLWRPTRYALSLFSLHRLRLLRAICSCASVVCPSFLAAADAPR